eukprot:m.259495 g.259495  ORF g.259495 m.259495 type:complete len:332 (+) comp38158_c0_seq1:135-1130(+)
MDAQKDAAPKDSPGQKDAPPKYEENIKAEEIDRLHKAVASVTAAETKMRDLLTQLGGSLQDIDNVKSNPMKFTTDSSPVKKELADAVLSLQKAEKAVATARRIRKEERLRIERTNSRREDEEAMMAVLKKDQEEVIQLNVGGEIIWTTKRTLISAPEGSVLEVAFSGRHGDLVQPVFFDRDPKAFSFILDFLRCVSAGQKPSRETFTIPEELAGKIIAEARFFNIPELLALVDVPNVKQVSTTTITYDQFFLMYVHGPRCFRGMNLSGFVFRGFDFGTYYPNGGNSSYHCDFSFCNLTGCDFSYANCKNANFRNANVNGCDFSHCTFLSLN